jgi:hypothetical protein
MASEICCSPETEGVSSQAAALSPLHKAALRELASRGSGGRFDQHVMSELFVLELVTVRNEDRRLVLTERGREAYDEIAGRLALE